MEAKIDRLYLLASPKTEEERGKGVRREVRWAGAVHGMAAVARLQAWHGMTWQACCVVVPGNGLVDMGHAKPHHSFARAWHSIMPHIDCYAKPLPMVWYRRAMACCAMP